MKRTFILLSCLFASSSFAAPLSLCPQALPANHPDFCSSFKSVAECHCLETPGIPKKVCQNTNLIYKLMIVRFKSQEKACEYQHDTTYQVCMDDWNCYRLGGHDSQNRLCSSTGKAC